MLRGTRGRASLAVGVAAVCGIVVVSSLAGWLGPSTPRPAGGGSQPPESQTSSAPSALVVADVREPERAPSPTAQPPPAKGDAAVSPAPSRATEPRAATSPELARAASPAPSPGVYRVQVGAFRDHQNADRLVERLKREGFGSATAAFEQGQVRHRVVILESEAGQADETAERVRTLGFVPERTSDGLVVTGLLGLSDALETSRKLRDSGIRVRLVQVVDSTTLKIVRVGAFATSAEAERIRSKLAERGFDGVVIRER